MVHLSYIEYIETRRSEFSTRLATILPSIKPRKNSAYEPRSSANAVFKEIVLDLTMKSGIRVSAMDSERLDAALVLVNNRILRITNDDQERMAHTLEEDLDGSLSSNSDLGASWIAVVNELSSTDSDDLDPTTKLIQLGNAKVVWFDALTRDACVDWFNTRF